MMQTLFGAARLSFNGTLLLSRAVPDMSIGPPGDLKQFDGHANLNLGELGVGSARAHARAHAGG